MEDRVTRVTAVPSEHAHLRSLDAILAPGTRSLPRSKQAPLPASLSGRRCTRLVSVAMVFAMGFGACEGTHANVGMLGSLVLAAEDRLKVLKDTLQEDARTQRLKDGGQAEHGLLSPRLEAAQQLVGVTEVHLDDARDSLWSASPNLGKAEASLLAAQVALHDIRLMHSDLVGGNNFVLHTGVAVTNPYRIDRSTDANGTNHYEQSSDSSTTGRLYVEAYFKSRYSWETPSALELPGTSAFKSTVYDYEAHIGYVAESGADDIAGSASQAAGDVYAMASVAFNFARLWDQESPLAYLKAFAIRPRGSIAIELTGGFVTDREFSDVHMSVGVGPVWTVGIPVMTKEMDGNGPAKYKLAEGLLGVYPYYRMDFPNFVDSDGQSIVTVRGEPDFQPQNGYMIRIGVNYPVSDNVTVIISASAAASWDREDNLPPPWSLFIGASIPLGKIL